MAERKCSDWINSLGHMTSNTESPNNYWMWSGIFTIGSVLRRRVWLDYGIDELLVPNLYVILISPPGRCRKGPPVSLAKRFLKLVGMNVSVDSASKQLIANEIAKTQSRIVVPELGTQSESPMAIISKEFSSLLSVDVGEMIKFLTDIYDYHEEWEYKVLSREADKLYGPFVSMMAATTPTYMANNVPYEAFGAGFFSRVLFIVGEDKRKREPWPGLTAEQVRLFEDLRHDLNIIKNLKGRVEISQEAKEMFEEWYLALDDKYEEITDEKFQGFIERAHIQVLKTSICLSVAESNELLVEDKHMAGAIRLIEEVFRTLPEALGSFGRSELSQDLNIVLKQIVAAGEISKGEILRRNTSNITLDTLNRIVEQLTVSGLIRCRIAGGKELFSCTGRST